ncbi:LmeA family phospholipid-binding protein [Agromyces larvae]|uniref:DUF2993 domain-containing protein n=1 Tax=Agromyces larvae TaxID=2929802 RepID=A0ABY4BZC0_9MICO|nr:DUF2993 domain-containing protein [Agromyces larvae]UOE44588.1 DUF2993 domain-containing protein [Agromyces larvae]
MAATSDPNAGAADTAVIPDGWGEPSPKRPRRGARAVIVAAVVVVVIAVLLAAADAFARSATEAQLAETIERRLPATVQGDVRAQVGGASVLWQLVTGTATEVALTSEGLTVQGAPVGVEVVARGVPLRGEGVIDTVDATLTLDEDSLNALVRAQHAPGGFSLGDGTVGYRGTLDVFGVTVSYEATARAEAAGDRVLLTPVGVEIGAGGVSVDAGDLVSRLLGGDPLEVCVADRLPEGAKLTSVQVTPERVRIEASAADVPMAAESLERTGDCG